MLHGIDDVLFHQAAGNTQVLGNLLVRQAIEFTQQEAVAAHLAQLIQSTLHQRQALVELHVVARRRGVPALVAVQHLQRLGLAHQVAAVAVDHQV
ncbi:hypothetical protein D3C80_1387890 [compost metagenome]